MLKTKIREGLKESLDIDIKFSVAQKIILKEATIANSKTMAAAVINATEHVDEDLVDILIDYNCEEMNWLYDDEELEQTVNFGFNDKCPPSHLLKINENDIIDVKFKDSLPTSITFSQLKAPIMSLAFQGLIKEIRFGSEGSHIFNFEHYQKTKTFLEEKNIYLPDNIFQTHYFLVYIQKYLPPTYVNVFLAEALYGGFTGIFELINILQKLYECPSYHSPDNTYKNNIVSLDKIDQLFIHKNIIYGDSPSNTDTYQGLVIFDYHTDAVTDSLLYNREKNKYMGTVHSDSEFTLYRSVPDMINSILSEDMSYFLFLATYRTFVKDNNISIDDGFDSKFSKHGNSEIEIKTDGFDFTWYEENLAASPITFEAGWEDAIPW